MQPHSYNHLFQVQSNMISKFRIVDSNSVSLCLVCAAFEKKTMLKAYRSAQRKGLLHSLV